MIARKHLVYKYNKTTKQLMCFLDFSILVGVIRFTG